MNATPDAPAVSSRTSAARRIVMALSWILIALLVVQVYLAGLFLMGGTDARVAHEALGWSMANLPFLTLIAAAFGRMPREFWISFAVLLVAIHVQTFLPLLSATDGLGWARALHPLNAVLLLALAAHQARLAGRLSRQASEGGA